MALESIEFWHWWVFAIALILVELLTPAFVFLWLGVAAGAVGFILLVVPSLTWQGQGLIFAVLSVGSIVGWRVYRHHRPAPESERPGLNRRGAQYLGRRFTLDKAIVNGAGILNIGDTRWKVAGDDLPAGTSVTVTGADGTVLKVEKAGDAAA